MWRIYLGWRSWDHRATAGAVGGGNRPENPEVALGLVCRVGVSIDVVWVAGVVGRGQRQIPQP